ncbi:hypothetical protein A0H81_12936 [Grifola frondosa]|uniref:Uncharacterized protein n=1 Tax=Grifola frondosa TaxID=5627 RepID=A0A1C7LTN0_GRIFR|nr:hypothetical protein A0H81_12936 [Grifola frondosa]
MLETFVDQVADAFVEGELYIRDWNAEKGANINLTFGTSSRMLMNIPLVELSPEDAASFATKMFTEIALEAQSRHCFLHPEDVKPPPVLSLGAAVWPTFSEPSSSKPTPRTPVSQEDIKALASHLAKQRQHMSTSTTNAPENKYKRKAQEAEEEVNVLKAELEKTRLQQQLAATESSKLISRTKPQPAVARRQGASLANPTKKARRYEELKFDSDED